MSWSQDISGTLRSTSGVRMSIPEQRQHTYLEDSAPTRDRFRRKEFQACCYEREEMIFDSAT